MEIRDLTIDALYEAAVNRGKERGAEAIELKVFAFNERAIAFYRSLGMTAQSLTMEKRIQE